MLRLKNITVGRKLLVLILVLLGAVIVVGLTGYRGIELLGALNRLSKQQQDAVRNMAAAERSYDVVRAVVFRALVAAQAGDDLELSATSEELPTAAGSVTGALKALATAPIEQEAKDTLIRIHPDVTAYLTKAQEIVSFAQGNKRAKAGEGIPQFRDAFTKAGEGLQELGLLVRGGTSFMTAQSEETAAVATKQAGIVFAVAVLLAAALGWTITKSITKPLAKMTTAVRASNQKAKEVAANSQQTAAVSLGGEQALEKASTGMRRIREQMDSIADSVIKLGEQSQTIGNIIDTVNELAEQSTLLAVNAAIEATNAGEHGKGFAVVAREVKNLATQSRHATAQVQNILNDIQKAANIAVLVTEQGTKSVEVGVSHSLEAGESIRLLSRNITEVAQAMTQIATSSEQQLLGIDQVAHAMANVQRATFQNAEGIRHIEGAARNLQSVGATLKELATHYTLTRNGAR